MSAKKQKEEGVKDLESLMEALQSRFGEGAIMTLGERGTMRKVESVSTGSFSLNLALGVGGFPKGRIIEIFGPESSGKTTLALHVVAETQKSGGRAAYIDAEHALDPQYASKIGVKIKELIISQPDNGEEALNILESLVRSNIIDVVVIDSVAALTPRAEIEGEMGDAHMGLQARLMSQALRKLTAIISKTKTTVIFINQLRMKIGIMFGYSYTLPQIKAKAPKMNFSISKMPQISGTFLNDRAAQGAAIHHDFARCPCHSASDITQRQVPTFGIIHLEILEIGMDPLKNQVRGRIFGINILAKDLHIDDVPDLKRRFTRFGIRNRLSTRFDIRHIEAVQIPIKWIRSMPRFDHGRV